MCIVAAAFVDKTSMPSNDRQLFVIVGRPQRSNTRKISQNTLIGVFFRSFKPIAPLNAKTSFVEAKWTLGGQRSMTISVKKLHCIK